jgi:hypothetical protein
MMFIPHRRQACGYRRTVTEIALLSYTYMIFVSDRRDTYVHSRPVPGRALICICGYVHNSRRHTCAHSWPVTGVVLLSSFS